MIRVFRSRSGIEEAHQVLIDDRLPDYFRAWKTTDPRDQSMGIAACAIDQFSQPRPPKLAQRSIGRDTTTAPG